MPEELEDKIEFVQAKIDGDIVSFANGVPVRIEAEDKIPELEKVLANFKKTKFAQGGGSCFECCDYEGMYSEMLDFIKSTYLKGYDRGFDEGEDCGYLEY